MYVYVCTIWPCLYLIPNRTELNECLEGNGGCEQMCDNTPGSFVCSCEDGYHLDENMLDCNGKSVLLFK